MSNELLSNELLSNPGDPVRRVKILLPLPLAGVLDYAAPAGWAPLPGELVVAPLNGRRCLGVVWDDAGGAGAGFPPERLKTLLERVEGVRLPADTRRFVDWVAAYTLAPAGEVLAMVLRRHALTEARPRTGVRRAAGATGEGLSAARARVLEVAGPEAVSATALARAAGVSARTIRAMLAAGLLEAAALTARPEPVAAEAAAVLSADQALAAAALAERVRARRFSVTLLRGVTGSGKTEAYFEAIRACLAEGRQALVLLPEIALSVQWRARFAASFGQAAAVWHSDLPQATRARSWREIAGGRAAVVVGARSALFLPFADLGLIVVDEEHESSFKQEDGVVYHARDMAVVRARLAGAPAVLVSATPSLETVANVEAGRYARLDLPARAGGALLPVVEVVDLRARPPARGDFLSPVVLERVAATLARGEQALLFLNRRGYAPLTLCRACGHRFQCPNCTAWLVEHRLRRVLACHHCDHVEPVPRACPACAASDSLVAVGPGVERITEEAGRAFAAARLLVMTSDTLVGPHAAAAAAAAIERREVDLVIGTQVIAKGWHFPHLTLVGVVDADLGLGGGDLRAGERTMQLLHQVAGRAGRGALPGAALLQTYQPAHPVMRALVAGDIDGFLRVEAAQRRPGHWPPYGRLAALIVSSTIESEADRVAGELGRSAPRGEGIEVFGPAPAPLAVLRGRHRRRLLLRTRREQAVQPLLVAWLARVRVGGRARVAIDVDPVSFL